MRDCLRYLRELRMNRLVGTKSAPFQPPFDTVVVVAAAKTTDTVYRLLYDGLTYFLLFHVSPYHFSPSTRPCLSKLPIFLRLSMLPFLFSFR